MITENQARELALTFLAGQGRNTNSLRIVKDTTNFFQIDYNDVLLLETGAYLIRGHEREGRFGLDDQIKHWVKKAVDLETGRRKVIKLVFFERFNLNIGDIYYECFRSPKKEARILELVRGNPNFMQGIATQDTQGNNVRIIDFISGPGLDRYVKDKNKDHEDYFYRELPDILDIFRPALAGLSFLHRHHEKHGDVRRDHLILSPEKDLAWIDFDYNYRHGEHLAGLDLYGLGNILAYLIGGGDHTRRTTQQDHPKAHLRLEPEDMNIVMNNRVMNLQKIFPYIPKGFNNILKHFSIGSEVFYDTVDQLLSDFDEAREDLPSVKSPEEKEAI